VVFVLISLKLATSAPAKFESESSVGQIFPYYVNVGTLDNPTYVYVAEEQTASNDNPNAGNALRTTNDIYGDCLETAACTKIFLPVCGTNERSYSNKCALDHESCLERISGRSLIRLKHEGMC